MVVSDPAQPRQHSPLHHSITPFHICFSKNRPKKLLSAVMRRHAPDFPPLRALGVLRENHFCPAFCPLPNMGCRLGGRVQTPCRPAYSQKKSYAGQRGTRRDNAGQPGRFRLASLFCARPQGARPRSAATGARNIAPPLVRRSGNGNRQSRTRAKSDACCRPVRLQF